MKFISGSQIVQNILTLFAFCFILMNFLFDIFYMKLYKIETFNFPLIVSIYLSMQIDFLVIAFSILILKFVVLSKTILRKFLEHKVWIPSSRSFQMITLLQIPLIYFVLFNVNHSIKFTLLRVIFLSLSMILFTYTVSLFMMIFISIPIKVGIKRLFK